uniref:CLIP-associating protein 2-like n=1 Tax=Petromyzon marinus TaxID=7757 RepID=A0AAJ7T7X6_PETMA|nr:CLIP-associating protein 2-like [Petromyzon marinus]
MKRLICKKICSYKAHEEDEPVEGKGAPGGKASRRGPGEGGTGRRQGPWSAKAATGREGAGAVDEEDFTKAFEDVPSVQIYSNRDLEDAMSKIRDILSDDKHDWEQRVAAVREVRSLLVAGATKHEGFLQQLRLMDPALKLSVRDLRSQVVRETCITLAYLSALLRNKFEFTAEAVLTGLFALVPNSAKVMATSGLVAIRLILKNTHAPRLTPIVCSNAASKAVSVRRRSFEFLDLMFQEWQTAALERHVSLLVDTVRKGITDADSDARLEARKAYWGLHNHAPGAAKALLTSLEPSYQRAVTAQRGGAHPNGSGLLQPHSDRSSSSSQESLNRHLGKRGLPHNVHVATKTKVPAGARKPPPCAPGAMQRSRSDVDVGAAHSAKARMAAGSGGASGAGSGVGVALGRERPPTAPARHHVTSSGYGILHKPGGVGSLGSPGERHGRPAAKSVSQNQRSRSSSPGRFLAGMGTRVSRGPRPPIPAPACALPAPPLLSQVPQAGAGGPSGQRVSRIPRSLGGSRDSSPARIGPSVRESRIPRVSLSQGCSRDTSRESSRDPSPVRAFTALSRGSRIPRVSLSQGCSRDTSRESSRDPSPVRAFTAHSTRQQSRSTSALTNSFVPSDPYSLMQSRGISSSVNAMRFLDPGSDVEAAVADALTGSTRAKRKPVRRRYDAYGMTSDDDAMSDASSACSERSCGSRGSRGAHGAPLAPGAPGPYLARQAEDVADILNRCASSNWAERRDGLLALQALLRAQRTLSRVELKRLCEIFTRMFADPHSKVSAVGVPGGSPTRVTRAVMSPPLVTQRREANPKCPSCHSPKVSNPCVPCAPCGPTCPLPWIGILQRVFSMFLETLVDFVLTHRAELHDWLFVLLTQLLKKMGADLLGSVQAKAQRCLDVTRECFPPDLQFNILMRFVVDQTQVLNLKVKVAVLRYICALSRIMEPRGFVNASETRLAVSRIITWTTEPKSSEVRKAAQAVLIALFELHPPEFTMLLGALPKTFQDGATRLLHNHIKATPKAGGNQASPSGAAHRAPMRPPANRVSPVTSPSASSQGTVSPGTSEADGEAGEEFYRSLRGVSQAIQSYSYRSQEDLTEQSPANAAAAGREQGTGAALGREGEGGRDTPDSEWRSHHTAPPRGVVWPHAQTYTIAYTQPCTHSLAQPAMNQATGWSTLTAPPIPGQGGPPAASSLAELLAELTGPGGRPEERRAALRELQRAGREEPAAAWEEHFKTVLLLLLETLADADHVTRSLALRVLSEFLRRQPTCFRKYAELTIMKVLEAHRDPHKEVCRAAEETASVLAASLPAEQCLKVLCPIVQTADFPINLAAIKMQTRVMQRLPHTALTQLLPDIIPGLLQGYDNTESSVRKASVFCLVAIHTAIGESLTPYLTHLSGSKMKLLNLYIQRAESNAGPGSPGSPALSLSGHCS